MFFISQMSSIDGARRTVEELIEYSEILEKS